MRWFLALCTGLGIVVAACYNNAPPCPPDAQWPDPCAMAKPKLDAGKDSQ